MTTNQNTTKGESVKDLSGELDGLLDETKKINQEIDETNKDARGSMDDLDARVNESIASMEPIYSDLDKIEEEAGNELDKLILEQVKDLAVE